MGKRWRCVELDKKSAETFRIFVKVAGYEHQISGCYNLVAFHLKIDEEEESIINAFLATL